MKPCPTLDAERDLAGPGRRFIAGLDEAGRGAWAGPVVAAAVILPLDEPDLAERLAGVCDSKLMTPQQREATLPLIYAAAVAVGVGVVAAMDIDRLGIAPATREAMLRALAQLDPRPDALLLDHVWLPIDLPQRAFPRADQTSLSVAAASVVAKVTRDRLLTALDLEFPAYGFARHKGYGTAVHALALRQHGPCAVHRRSYAPVQAVQLTLDFDMNHEGHEGHVGGGVDATG